MPLRRPLLALLLAAPLAASASPPAPPAAAGAPPPLALSRAPEGAPNVVVVLLDDVGFAAPGTFGGPVPTPALDRLAAQGLRYVRFHTTGICSPTRASLLTGRNPHAVGVGAVLNSAANHPGRRGVLAPSAATFAELLRQHGYATALFGKWHLVPDWEATPAGPFDRWPTRQGFDRFYGFLGGETDQYEPTLYDGTTPVVRPPREPYHLSEDLADQAIAWMRLQRSLRPERPFLVYLAPGATHAPLQVPRAWSARFAGRFDQGWDALREESFARQKRLGVIPQDAALTPRPDGLPAWDALTPEQKRVAARLMEVYAGFLAHTDAQVGRVLDALAELGVADDTLVVYLTGDNGASAEGGLYGSWSYTGRIQGLDVPPDYVLARLDRVGEEGSYPHFPAGFAWALDAPFQWTKQVASHLGGIRNGAVIAWPARIRERGGVRSQFAHVNDVAPTILEAAGIAPPAEVNGVAQQPFDGTSLVYSFDDANAAGRHRTQYFEVYGNRGLYHDGWMASAFRGRPPWQVMARMDESFDADRWELYDLDADFSQAHDRAADEPAKLAELRALFDAEAARNGVLPLGNATTADASLPSLSAGRSRFVYGPGAVRIWEREAPPLVNRSYALTASVEVPERGARGVLASAGGSAAGWSLYLDAQGRPAYAYDAFDAARMELVGAKPLAPGRHVLRYAFAYDGGGMGKGGTGTLSVDGKEVARGRLERSVPVFFSIDETFDVGTDSGSPAGSYPPNDAFTGTLHELVVELE